MVLMENGVSAIEIQSFELLSKTEENHNLTSVKITGISTEIQTVYLPKLSLGPYTRR
jgi:hypothetical protein